MLGLGLGRISFFHGGNRLRTGQGGALQRRFAGANAVCQLLVEHRDPIGSSFELLCGLLQGQLGRLHRQLGRMQSVLAIPQDLPHLCEKALGFLSGGLGQVQARRGLRQLCSGGLQPRGGVLKFDLELQPCCFCCLVSYLRLCNRFQRRLFRRLRSAGVFSCGFGCFLGNFGLADGLGLRPSGSLVPLPCTRFLGLCRIGVTPGHRPCGPGFLGLGLGMGAQVLRCGGGGLCLVSLCFHRQTRGLGLFGLLPQTPCFLFCAGALGLDGGVQDLNATDQFLGQTLGVGEPSLGLSLGVLCFRSSGLCKRRPFPELLLPFLGGFGRHFCCSPTLACLFLFGPGCFSHLPCRIRLGECQLGARMFRIGAFFRLDLDGLCIREGHLGRAEGRAGLLHLGPGIHRLRPCTFQVCHQSLQALFQSNLFCGERFHLLQHRVRRVAGPSQSLFQLGNPRPGLHHLFLDHSHFRPETLHLHMALFELILHFLDPSVFVSPQLLLLGLQLSMPPLERGFLFRQILQAARQLHLPILELGGNRGGKGHPRPGHGGRTAGIQQAAQVPLEGGRGDGPRKVLIRGVGTIHVVDELGTRRCLAEHDHRRIPEPRVLLDPDAQIQGSRVVSVENHQHGRTLDHQLQRLLQVRHVFKLHHAARESCLNLRTCSRIRLGHEHQGAQGRCAHWAPPFGPI